MTCSLPESFAIVLLAPKRIYKFEISQKENTFYVTPDHPYEILLFFRCHINTRFGISIDICGVDYPSSEQRTRVLYQLPTTQYKSCVRIKISVNEITLVSSVISLFPSAGWWEREVWDTSGIAFSNYRELRRILTDYGFEGHPLRKDFPLSGYVEVRYDDSEKCVVSESIEMAQEFRSSQFTTPWQLMPSRSYKGKNGRAGAKDKITETDRVLKDITSIFRACISHPLGVEKQPQLQLLLCQLPDSNLFFVQCFNSVDYRSNTTPFPLISKDAIDFVNRQIFFKCISSQIYYFEVQSSSLFEDKNFIWTISVT